MAFLDTHLYALESVRDVTRTESEAFHILQEVADILRHDVPHYSAVGIYLVEGQEISLHAFSGDDEPEEVRLPLAASSPLGEVGLNGKSLRIADGNGDVDVPRFGPMRSMFLAPVVLEDGPGGVLLVESEEAQAFDDSDEEFLEHVAELVGDGIDRSDEDRML